MDLKTIQREAHKIAEIVDEWSYQRTIPSLERDLVLEKLMSLYDMVRFSAKRVETDNSKNYAHSYPDEHTEIRAITPSAAQHDTPQSYSAPIPPVMPSVADTADDIVEVTPSHEVQPSAAIPSPAPAAPQSIETGQPHTEMSHTEMHEEPVHTASAPVEPIHIEPVHTEPAPQVVAEAQPTQVPVTEHAEAQHLKSEEETPLNPVELHKQKQRLILSLYDMESASEPAPATPATDMSGYDEKSDDNYEDNDEPFEVISVASAIEESTATAQPEETTPSQEEAPVEPAHVEAPVAEPTPVVEPAPTAEAPSHEEVKEEEAQPQHDTPEQEVAETPVEAPAAPQPEVQPAEPTATQPVEQFYEESEEEDELSDEDAFSVITPHKDEEDMQDEEDEELEDEHPLYRTEEIHEGAVLGEVINAHVQTLGDSMQVARDTVSEAISNDRTTDLMKAIGINDKFLMIHDLFGGDSDEYERVISTLNKMESLDDSLIYIAEHFSWNPNSDGAKLLEELLERKFS